MPSVRNDATRTTGGRGTVKRIGLIERDAASVLGNAPPKQQAAQVEHACA